jgi:hypothetical protein
MKALHYLICIVAISSLARAQVVDPIAIPNYNFALPVVSATTYDPSLASQDGTGWTFSSNSGIAPNGSLGLTNAPYGSQAAFIQSTGNFSQVISVSSNGLLNVTLSAEASGTLGVDSFMVTLDGVPLKFGSPYESTTLTPTTTTSFTTYECEYTAITPGSHTLSIVGLSTTGTATTFFGSVAASSFPDISPTPLGIGSPIIFNEQTGYTGAQQGTYTVDPFNGSVGYSGTQGQNQWSYAYVTSAGASDLWNNQQFLTYFSATNDWRDPAGTTPYINATQQAMTEGTPYYSLRYWTADKNYPSITIASDLHATRTVGAYLAYVSAATHLTTQITPVSYSSASTITADGGAEVMQIPATLTNVKTGDRIYFVLQNFGSGSNGSGVLQTWGQTFAYASVTPTQWSYAYVNYTGASDLWDNQISLTFYSATNDWRSSSGTIPWINATQQTETEGNSNYSLRYWTADQGYSSVQLTSTLYATNTVGAFLAYVPAATHLTTRLTSTYFSSASTIAADGGTEPIPVNASLTNVHAGDRVYFVLQNFGAGGNGSGIPQTWAQAVAGTDPMSLHLGVHAQTLPDPSQGHVSAYLDKANSMYALGGPSFVVRDFIQWQLVQPTATGPINFSDADAAVAKAQLNDQKIIFCLCFTPSWANGGQNDTYPATGSYWQTFVQACASRYKSSGVIAGWELWNEEPSPTFFESSAPTWTGRAQDYANLILVPGYNAIRAVDPVTPVLFGGMDYGGTASNGTDNSADGFMPNVLMANSAAPNSFDYIGYHPYFGDPAQISGVFDQLRNQMAAFGINKPIVCTEWGALAPSNSPTSEATFLELLTIFQAKGVKYACYHYSISAESLDYGLFDWQTPQPTSIAALNDNDWHGLAQTYSAWMDLLEGYSFQAKASFNGLVPANTVGYTFTPIPNSNTTTVIWNYTGTASVQVLVGAASSATIVQWNPATDQKTTSAATITSTPSGNVVTVSASPNPTFLQLTF